MTTARQLLRLNARVALLALKGRWLSTPEIAAGYDRVARHYDENWLVKLRPVTDTLLPELNPQVHGRVLDLGCGTGYATRRLGLAFPSAAVRGVDISEGMLEQARLSSPPNVRYTRADMLDFLRQERAGSVTMIFSAWALGYSHPSQLLRECGRVLEEGGSLKFVVNFADTLAPVFRAFRKCMFRYPALVQRAAWPRFPKNEAQLRGMLHQAGFEVGRFTNGRHPIPPPEGALLPWLKKTGILAGFEALLPLDGEVGEYFEEELRAEKGQLYHHFALVEARRVGTRTVSEERRDRAAGHGTGEIVEDTTRLGFGGEFVRRAGQYFQLLRILVDRRVTCVPRQVLAELTRQGKRKLPAELTLRKGVTSTLRSVRYLQRWLEGEHITRHNGQWVINSFLPPFPGPAYERMFTNLLSGRRVSPVSAFLAVTAECPYHCWHCSSQRRQAGRLETADWVRTIQDLHRLGASIIGFTGGEPCVREDLPELVRAAAEGGANTLLFTSGARVTPELLGRLKAAGLWGVCVSLDHPDPAEHDRMRGSPGAHARALDVLRDAAGLGFYTMAGAVGTRKILEVLPRLHELVGRCGVQELRIVEPMPCGMLAGGAEQVLLRADETRALRRFHTETNRRGPAPKVCAFNQIESPELFGCGAGTQHLYIDSSGEVCPCDFTAMSFGNVRQESLAEVWTRMSNAMGSPRRHCFIQKHHGLIRSHSGGKFPLPVEQSLAVCQAAGHEDLPDYFQLIMGKQR